MKKLVTLLSVLFSALSVFGQTNPTAVSIPYKQDFGVSTFTSLPIGFACWNGLNGGTISTQNAAENSVPTGNATISAATAAMTTGGAYGYSASANARFYIQTSSNATNGVNQLILAINTTGKFLISVSYDIEIISAQSRTIGMVLQYRVGQSGAWATVSGTGNPFTQTAGTTGVKATAKVILPQVANNQSLVQLRWAIWRGTDAGSSAGIGIDNISVGDFNADGTGTAKINVNQWILNTQKDLSFTFKKDTSSISAVKIIIPEYFSWSKSSDDVETTSGFTINGDSIVFTPDFSSVDSFKVIFKNLILMADTTFLYSWSILSKSNGDLKPLGTFPSTLIIGSPKTIAEARGNNVDGSVKNLGKYITVRGIVTVANEYGGPSVIQDATAGLSIYSPDVSPIIKVGDEIVLVGSISQFNGLTELISATLIETISEENIIEPLELSIAQIKADGVGGVENYESQLVRIKDVTVTNTVWTSGTSGTNYPLTDASGTMDIRVDNNVDFAGTPAPGSAFTVVGVLSQFVAAAPFIGGYQLLPRSKADIITSGVGFNTLPHETEMTTTSVKLSWENSATATPGAKYGLTPKFELGKIVGNNAATANDIVIEGLTASTVYYVKPFAFIGTDTSFAQTMLIVSKSESTGKINVLFNQSVDISKSIGENAKGNIVFSDTLVKRINNTKKSISVALYSLSGGVGAKVANALIAAQARGVIVRVIMEQDNSSTTPPNNLRNNGVPYITDQYGLNSGDGLMHNKFLVIDVDTNNPNDAWVWMGSYNTTDPGEQNDYQNVVEIQDKSLAKIYTLEFNEMWGSSTASPNSSTSRFGANKLNNTPHRLLIDSTWVESYFSPSDQVSSQIKKTILTTDYQGYVSMLSYTRDELSKAEQTKVNEGKKFINIVDNNTDTGAQFSFLGTFSEAYIHNIGGLYHHKYLIVDHNQKDSDPIVLTGSHNWSTSAETKNNENTLIFHSYRIANLFVQEFAARYAEVGGGSVIPTLVNQTGKAETFEVFGNYPNPFNPSTKLKFSIPANGTVSIDIFNLLGQKIQTVLNTQLDKGSHEIIFNGSHISSGIYFYSVRFNGISKTGKFILSK